MFKLKNHSSQEIEEKLKKIHGKPNEYKKSEKNTQMKCANDFLDEFQDFYLAL